MSGDRKNDRGNWRQAAADSWPPLVLAGIAFGGSFSHWVHLATKHGQHGVLAPAIAVCVDLGVYMATRERQRDARIGRERRGATSWPTLLLVLCILLTLAGNVASAQRTPWGITVALIPGAFLLAAISLMERRAAEDGRRAAAAERQRQADEAAERQRQAELAAERQRQAAAAREAAERQAAAEREAAEAERRRAERQSALAARHAEIVSAASVPVGPGAGRLALPAGSPAPSAGPAPAPAPTATDVMRAYWDTTIGAGGAPPSGADLLRAAGLPATSSLGRQNAAKWRAELDARGASREAAGARS